MLWRLFALLRGLVIGTIFVSIWTLFLPRWLARAALQPLRPAAYVPMAIGGAIVLRCVWDFAWRGAGTPAPFDPPRRLVVSGLYRFVRNPMYLGLGTFMIGEAFLFPSITMRMSIAIAILVIIVNGFVILYEEPHLRRLFGPDYDEYCRAVGRWIPRLRPYQS